MEKKLGWARDARGGGEKQLDLLKIFCWQERKQQVRDEALSLSIWKD